MPLLLAILLTQTQFDKPVRTETITPTRIPELTWDAKVKPLKQGGNPRLVGSTLVFDGCTDGNRQVDPQVAVGGGFVVHGTNSGLFVYDKKGNWKAGVPHHTVGGGIDPKLCYDVNNKVFCYDVWTYWDKEKKKPVNIAMTNSSDPTKGWNNYAISIPQGVDGGAVALSRKWVGYSYPGGPNNTFVMHSADMKAGKPTQVYHFAGSLGHPVLGQDRVDDLYFLALTDQDVVITRVTEGDGGVPFIASVVRAPHKFRSFGWPPGSPMKGVTQKTASGDRNPKNVVLQNGCLWFSQTVNIDGRAAIQWHQVKLDGTFVQSGTISDPKHSFIETSLAVNKRGDVLVGFQETGPDMFISARCAYRLASDPLGTLRPMIKLAEGTAATEGGAWGDYSGCAIDGDNLLDLWTVQSVANDKGRGSTVIAQVTPKK